MIFVYTQAFRHPWLNSVEPDQMLQNEAYDQDLPCLLFIHQCHSSADKKWICSLIGQLWVGDKISKY